MQIKKRLQPKIYLTSERNDSNDVVWKDLDTKEVVGVGYQGKSDKRLHVIRCPMCLKENYGMTVASGFCAWCGFDANYEANHKDNHA